MRKTCRENTLRGSQNGKGFLRNGRSLSIGVCNRYANSLNRIKKMIADGMLGEIYHVYASFRAYHSIPGLGGDFTTKAVSGGGTLIDWGVNYLDLIVYC